MNLQTEIRAVRERIGEPARTDQMDNYITDEEILSWIYDAEQKIVRDVVEDALLEMLTLSQANTAAADGDYALPSDFERIIGVSLNSGQGHIDCRIIKPTQKHLLETNPNWRPTGLTPVAWIFAGQVYVRPTPVAIVTNGIEIRYIKTPTRRYKHVESFTTAAGTASSIVDGALTQPNDYWNASTMRLKTGALAGQERTISDFVLSTTTLTVSTAFDAAPGTSIYYEMGTPTDLGDNFSPLIVAWASYLGLTKDRETDISQTQKDEYERGVAQINARYAHIHQQETRRSTSNEPS